MKAPLAMVDQTTWRIESQGRFSCLVHQRSESKLIWAGISIAWQACLQLDLQEGVLELYMNDSYITSEKGMTR